MEENSIVSPIKGDDIILRLNDKTTYHATSHQVSLDANFEEYQTKDTNGKMNILTGHSGTAQADCLVCVLGEDNTDSMDTEAILDAFNSGKKVTLTLSLMEKLYTANAWITSLNISAPVAANATCSASFKFDTLTPAV